MRDRECNSSRGRRAFTIATMILRSKFALETSISDLKEHLLRTHFSGVVIQGPKSSIAAKSLQYDSKWLDEPSNGLRELWCNFHQLLSLSSSDCNKFNIMAWLSTNAYAKSADMVVIQTLVAFYRMRGFAEIEVPDHPSFVLSHGSAWNDAEILALNFSRSFMDSSEAQLPRRDYETEKEHVTRIESLFYDQQALAMQDFIARLKKQWPCYRPSTPTSTIIDTYLDTSKAMDSVSNKFNNWYRNKCFLEYLQKVSSLIARQACLRAPTLHYPLTEAMKKRSANKKDRFFDMNKFFAQTPPSNFQHSKCFTIDKTRMYQH
jgi:hypothetical protein